MWDFRQGGKEQNQDGKRANHPGEIKYLTLIAKPKVAMINNIAPAHLEGFGSVKGVASASYNFV